MDFFCHSLDICIPISESSLSSHKSPMEEHNTLSMNDKGWRKNSKPQAKISLKGEESTISHMEKLVFFVRSAGLERALTLTGFYDKVLQLILVKNHPPIMKSIKNKIHVQNVSPQNAVEKCG